MKIIIHTIVLTNFYQSLCAVKIDYVRMIAMISVMLTTWTLKLTNRYLVDTYSRTETGKK